MWWVCILHHFVVGLHYIILWWVCNISLCGEIVFHHFVLHHCSGLVLHQCGEFVIHPCVVSGSSLLWCFYIIYFVVIFFSMVHSILVRFYYFPLLFMILTDLKWYLPPFYLKILTIYLFFLVMFLAPESLSPKINHPYFCDKNLLIFCRKGNNFCVLPQQWLPLQTEEVNSLSHGGNTSDIQVPIKMLAIRCPVVIKKLLMAAYIY